MSLTSHYFPLVSSPNTVMMYCHKYFTTFNEGWGTLDARHKWETTKLQNTSQETRGKGRIKRYGIEYEMDRREVVVRAGEGGSDSLHHAQGGLLW